MHVSLNTNSGIQLHCFLEHVYCICIQLFIYLRRFIRLAPSGWKIKRKTVFFSVWEPPQLPQVSTMFPRTFAYTTEMFWKRFVALLPLRELHIENENIFIWRVWNLLASVCIQNNKNQLIFVSLPLVFALWYIYILNFFGLFPLIKLKQQHTFSVVNLHFVIILFFLGQAPTPCSRFPNSDRYFCTYWSFHMMTK